MTSRDTVGIGSFACVFGEQERTAEDIADFDALWRTASPDMDFAAMGCGTFRTMTRPVEEYAVEAIRRTLGRHAVAPPDVDHVVFATSDAQLGPLGRDFAVRVLDAAGLTASVPVVLSFQQCCSSLTALQYAWDLFRDERVANVVLVSLDFTPDDRDRVRSFALFGDAVASCLISRSRPGLVRLLASAVHTDEAGLRGEDSFVSRQKVAQASLARVWEKSGERLEDVTKAFPTNLYKPVTVFNAMVAGVRQETLHFTETLHAYGHCGTSDWMINLVDHQSRDGIRPGATYLALASAPGFFACGLLAGV